MRIRDCSSDVCASDLSPPPPRRCWCRSDRSPRSCVPSRRAERVNMAMKLMKRSVAPLILLLGLEASAAALAAVPDIQEVTSPGGVKAWLVEDHGTPTPTPSCSLVSGASPNPPRGAAQARLGSGLLDQGAGRRGHTP